MQSLMRRTLLIGTLAAAIFSCWLPVSSVQAQTGNWEYSEELGGWLDWDTGLVWGEQKGISTWDGAVGYVGRLSTNTGKPWRLPAVAECQVATAHGIYGVPGIFYRASENWTSDAKNKGGARTAHYSFNFYSNAAILTNNKSLIDTIPVYGPIF